MFLTHFWSIFPILGAKIFFWKIQLLRKTSYGFVAPHQNLEKTNDAIPRKRPKRWKDGRTDRPYFIGPLRVTLEVQKVKKSTHKKDAT